MKKIFLLRNMLKEKHMEVLRRLRTNARTTFSQISRETGIPVTSVFDYFTILKKETIERQVSLLNFEKLGFHCSFIFIAKCFDNKELIDYLKKDSRVNNIFLSGRKTIIFEVFFKDEDETTAFVKFIERFKIIRLQEYNTECIKREEFMP